MIQITKRQLAMVEELRERYTVRGNIKLNTRIVYELWQPFFGVRKRPNGCNACLRADMNQFMTKYDQLSNEGQIEVIDSKIE